MPTTNTKASPGQGPYRTLGAGSVQEIEIPSAKPTSGQILVAMNILESKTIDNKKIFIKPNCNLTQIFSCPACSSELIYENGHPLVCLSCSAYKISHFHVKCFACKFAWLVRTAIIENE